MRYIKLLAGLALPFLLVSLLWSQDLTEAAKKEKERREAVKGKTPAVITNADLGSVKKKPIVEVEGTEVPVEPEAGQADQPPAPSNPADQATDNADQGEPQPASEPLKVVPEVNTEPMATDTPTQKQTKEAEKSLLETQWLKAKEYADLLELKMNGLWQDFYNMDDMTPKDQIQQKIAETFDKYQQARDAEAKAKDALDKSLGITKK